MLCYLQAICGICDEEVFIACPLCLVYLCYDHRNSGCDEHKKRITTQEQGKS